MAKAHKGTSNVHEESRRPADSACVGCGYCCHKAPCTIGYQLHGSVAPCPELLFAGGRHWCRWIITRELLKDEDQAELSKMALHIGVGCGSSMNSWRRKPIVDRTDPESNTQEAPSSFLDFMREAMSQCSLVVPLSTQHKEDKP